MANDPPDDTGDPAPDGPLSESVLRLRWDAPGDELRARYRLREVLGKGGMGVVWLGHDRRMQRDVAIKVSPLQEGPDDATRFLQEAQVTGQLSHPNIPPIYDLGLGPGGAGWFSMRALPGRSLSQVLREGPLGIARALEIFGKVCDAVGYAHDRDVLHLDLKPGNLIVGDFGEVYVIDWGLARKVSKGPPTATFDAQTAEVRGTPAYMSPEQAADTALDVRTDVYALGSLLYAMVTGKAPFGTGEEALRRRASGEIPAPRRLRPDLPWELSAVIRRAMAVRPEARYATVAELQHDLVAFREGRPLPGVTYSMPRRLAGALGRNRRRLVTAVLVGGLVGSLGLTTLAAYAFTMEAARDRAVAAEREAEGRSIAQQVALARFRASAGSPPRARTELTDVLARARELGLDDGPGVVALAALDEEYPPPEVRIPGVEGAILDPDGDRVALRVGRTVHVHSLATGERLRSWTATGDVTLDRFEGEAVLVLVRDGARLDRVDAMTGTVRSTTTLGPPRAEDAVVVSGDGRRLAWTRDGRTTIFEDGRVVAELDRVVAALSEDGRKALVFTRLSAHRQVEHHDVVDVETGDVLWSWPVGSDFLVTPELDVVVVTGAVGATAFDRDGHVLWQGGPAVPGLGIAGNTLALFGTDGQLELRDVRSGEIGLRRPVGDGRVVLSGMPLIGGGYVAAMIDGELRAWSRAAPKRRVPAHSGAALAIDVSPDGELVATAGWEGGVALWDRASGAELARWPVCAEGVRDVSFSPDGTRLATADRAGAVHVIELGSDQIGPSLLAERGIVMGARWWGEHVVAAYQDGHLLDWADGKPARDLHEALVTTWGLALGTRHAVVAGREGSDPAGELWDLEAGRRVATTAELDLGYGAAVSADGSRWAVGLANGTVIYVDGQGEHLLKTPVMGPVMALALSPDGAWLAAGLFDGQLTLFDARQYTEVLSTPLLPAPLMDLAFVPGTGIVLATGGEAGAWTSLDLGRTSRLEAVALGLVPGAGAIDTHAAARAELAGDWRHATGATGLALARARLALGDRAGAAAALENAGGSVGTLAAWRRATAIPR